MEIGKQVIEMALENGATVAGVASTKALKSSASHVNYTKIGPYAGVGTVSGEDVLARQSLFNWPTSAPSVLVIGLSHPKDRPEMDWWDGNGTPGNRRLIQILTSTHRQIETRLKVNTHPLHYYVEKGGMFLKDAAVLAGLGVIGANNLVVTPDYGPRIRFRGLLVDAVIGPTASAPFYPCTDCSKPCRSVCPEKAMDERSTKFEAIQASMALPAGDGKYDRALCNIRMEKDVAASKKQSTGKPTPIKYCRWCELVCPVGKTRSAPAAR